jgi:pentatricopeptide repeat protein
LAKKQRQEKKKEEAAAAKVKTTAEKQAAMEAALKNDLPTVKADEHDEHALPSTLLVSGGLKKARRAARGGGGAQYKLERQVERIRQRLAGKEEESETMLKAASREKNIKLVNQLIADFGKRKQLHLASRAWIGLFEAGLQPTVYTLTTMVNAYVRCGETSKAASLIKELLALVSPNVVTYTALVKGYTEAGDLDEASSVLRAMRDAGLEANNRTFQSLLKGAVSWGGVAHGRAWWADLCALQAPTLPAYESWIRTLCQAGLAQEAWAEVEETQQ